MEKKKEKKVKKTILLNYFEKQRLRRKAQGSSFTAVNYQSAMQSVRRFLKKRQLYSVWKIFRGNGCCIT